MIILKPYLVFILSPPHLLQEFSRLDPVLRSSVASCSPLPPIPSPIKCNGISAPKKEQETSVSGSNGTSFNDHLPNGSSSPTAAAPFSAPAGDTSKDKGFPAEKGGGRLAGGWESDFSGSSSSNSNSSSGSSSWSRSSRRREEAREAGEKRQRQRQRERARQKQKGKSSMVMPSCAACEGPAGSKCGACLKVKEARGGRDRGVGVRGGVLPRGSVHGEKTCLFFRFVVSSSFLYFDHAPSSRRQFLRVPLTLLNHASRTTRAQFSTARRSAKGRTGVFTRDGVAGRGRRPACLWR